MFVIICKEKQRLVNVNAIWAKNCIFSLLNDIAIEHHQIMKQGIERMVYHILYLLTLLSLLSLLLAVHPQACHSLCSAISNHIAISQPEKLKT